MHGGDPKTPGRFHASSVGSWLADKASSIQSLGAGKLATIEASHANNLQWMDSFFTQALLSPASIRTEPSNIPMKTENPPPLIQSATRVRSTVTPGWLDPLDKAVPSPTADPSLPMAPMPKKRPFPPFVQAREKRQRHGVSTASTEPSAHENNESGEEREEEDLTSLPSIQPPAPATIDISSIQQDDPPTVHDAPPRSEDRETTCIPDSPPPAVFHLSSIQHDTNQPYEDEEEEDDVICLPAMPPPAPQVFRLSSSPAQPSIHSSPPQAKAPLPTFQSLSLSHPTTSTALTGDVSRHPPPTFSPSAVHVPVHSPHHDSPPRITFVSADEDPSPRNVSVHSVTGQASIFVPDPDPHFPLAISPIALDLTLRPDLSAEGIPPQNQRVSQPAEPIIPSPSRLSAHSPLPPSPTTDQAPGLPPAPPLRDHQQARPSSDLTAISHAPPPSPPKTYKTPAAPQNSSSSSSHPTAAAANPNPSTSINTNTRSGDSNSKGSDASVTSVGKSASNPRHRNRRSLFDHFSTIPPTYPAPSIETVPPVHPAVGMSAVTTTTLPSTTPGATTTLPQKPPSRSHTRSHSGERHGQVEGDAQARRTSDSTKPVDGSSLQKRISQILSKYGSNTDEPRVAPTAPTDTQAPTNRNPNDDPHPLPTSVEEKADPANPPPSRAPATRRPSGMDWIVDPAAATGATAASRLSRTLKVKRSESRGPILSHSSRTSIDPSRPISVIKIEPGLAEPPAPRPARALFVSKRVASPAVPALAVPEPTPAIAAPAPALPAPAPAPPVIPARAPTPVSIPVAGTAPPAPVSTTPLPITTAPRNTVITTPGNIFNPAQPYSFLNTATSPDPSFLHRQSVPRPFKPSPTTAAAIATGALSPLRDPSPSGITRARTPSEVLANRSRAILRTLGDPTHLPDPDILRSVPPSPALADPTNFMGPASFSTPRISTSGEPPILSSSARKRREVDGPRMVILSTGKASMSPGIPQPARPLPLPVREDPHVRPPHSLRTSIIASRPEMNPRILLQIAGTQMDDSESPLRRTVVLRRSEERSLLQSEASVHAPAPAPAPSSRPRRPANEDQQGTKAFRSLNSTAISARREEHRRRMQQAQKNSIHMDTSDMHPPPASHPAPPPRGRPGVKPTAPSTTMDNRRVASRPGDASRERSRIRDLARIRDASRSQDASRARDNSRIRDDSRARDPSTVRSAQDPRSNTSGILKVNTSTSFIALNKANVSSNARHLNMTTASSQKRKGPVTKAKPGAPQLSTRTKLGKKKGKKKKKSLAPADFDPILPPPPSDEEDAPFFDASEHLLGEEDENDPYADDDDDFQSIVLRSVAADGKVHYYLPEIDDESQKGDKDDDEESDPRVPVNCPKWATKDRLHSQMARQRHINPNTIFGPIRPLYLTEIFRSTDVLVVHERRASSYWEGTDILTVREEEAYARRMNFR